MILCVQLSICGPSIVSQLKINEFVAEDYYKSQDHLAPQGFQ